MKLLPGWLEEKLPLNFSWQMKAMIQIAKRCHRKSWTCWHPLQRLIPLMASNFGLLHSQSMLCQAGGWKPVCGYTGVCVLHMRQRSTKNSAVWRDVGQYNLLWEHGRNSFTTWKQSLWKGKHYQQFQCSKHWKMAVPAMHSSCWGVSKTVRLWWNYELVKHGHFGIHYLLAFWSCVATMLTNQLTKVGLDNGRWNSCRFLIPANPKLLWGQSAGTFLGMKPTEYIW